MREDSSLLARVAQQLRGSVSCSPTIKVSARVALNGRAFGGCELDTCIYERPAVLEMFSHADS